MATYLSTTEEEARKKLAATSPYTSLTSKTLTSTTPTVAPKTTTTSIVPKTTTTTAPTPTSYAAPTPKPVDQIGTSVAPAQPASAPAPTTATTTAAPVKTPLVPIIGAGSTGSTGGGVSMADSGLTKSDDQFQQQQQYDGGVTAERGAGDPSVIQKTDPIGLNDWFASGAGDTDFSHAITGSDPLARDAVGDAGSVDRTGSAADDSHAWDITGDNPLDRERVGEPGIDSMLEDFVRSGLSGDEYDDVNINADPYEDVSINHKTDREMDSASRKNIMKLLGYEEGDTGDEEKYIENRVADRLGQQLVGSRASMGRAGFGSSGALYGMEGDQMRQANLDAEGRIYDVREREQNQAFDRNMAGAGLADDRDERLYDRATDDAELDLRNQDERYGRATDEADNDYRNQTTEFGQKMDVAGLDQQGRQGARQDAILKAQMDAMNALFEEGGSDDAPRPEDSANQTAPGGGIADEDRTDINMSESSKANIPSAAYSEGSSYAGSDDEFDYFTNAQNQFYKVPRETDPNAGREAGVAKKEELLAGIRERNG